MPPTAARGLLLAALVAGAPAAASGGEPAPPVPGPSRVPGPSAPLVLTRAPLAADRGRPPRSLPAAALGFLAGDALAAGIGWASFAAYHRWRGDDGGMGAVGPYGITAFAAIAAPPLLGTWAGAPGGSARTGALLRGGALHVAGLLGAVALWRADRREGAVAVLLAADLVVGPWAVALEPGPTPDGPEPRAAFAYPGDGSRRAPPVGLATHPR